MTHTINHFKNYLIRVIGQKKISAPICAWNALYDKPYKNSLFTINFDKHSQSIIIETKPHYSKSLILAQNMLKNVHYIKKLTAHGNYLTFDTKSINIPGRWACMLHDFYFIQNKYHSIVEVNDGELNFKDDIDSHEDEINHIYDMSLYPSVLLNIICGPSYPHDYVPDSNRKISNDKIWETKNGYGNLSVYYTLDMNDNLLSLDRMKYKLTDRSEGGIEVPMTSFLAAEHILYNHDKSDIIGRYSYCNQRDIQIEELVVFEEAIKKLNGITNMKIYN